MSQPFVGEIRMFGGNFAPRGWAFCNGQTLPISQNAALFSLIGTTYGGNGTTTFMLPNLQGQVPIHWGSAPGGTVFTVGETGGSANVTLTAAQMPAHSHQAQAGVSNLAGNVTDPTNAVPAQINNGSVKDPATGIFGYSSSAATGHLAPSAVTNTGGSQPHSVMQPYLCVTFIIALQGIFPSRN
ncbi:MAG: tail fiber protein [Bryobacteraceae bacterium]|jgi:microcystin-dependent protein